MYCCFACKSNQSSELDNGRERDGEDDEEKKWFRRTTVVFIILIVALKNNCLRLQYHYFSSFIFFVQTANFPFVFNKGIYSLELFVMLICNRKGYKYLR